MLLSHKTSIKLNKACKCKIVEYCKKYKDIKCVDAVLFEESLEISVSVEDASNDNILEYNEFMFQLREEYPEISDFWVLVEEECSSLIEERSHICIYKRN